MDKLIIDLGLENITVAKIQVKGKTVKVLEADQIPSEKCLTSNGNINIKEVINKLKEIHGDVANKLDTEIILPNHMSEYNFREVSKSEKTIAKSKPSGKFDTVVDTVVSDKGSNKILGSISYTKSDIEAMTKELYRNNINVTCIIPSISAYYRAAGFMRYSDDSPENGYKLFVDIGVNNIKFIILANGLPVFCKDSDTNLSVTYQTVRERNQGLTMNQFIAIFRSSSPGSYREFDDVLSVSQSYSAIKDAQEREYNKVMADAFDNSIYEQEQNTDTNTNEAETQNNNVNGILADIDYSVKNETYKEIENTMSQVSQQIREIIDYIHDTYSEQSVEIHSNSSVAMQYIQNKLSDVYYMQTNLELSNIYEIKNIRFDLERLHRKYYSLLGCLGEIVYRNHKGVR